MLERAGDLWRLLAGITLNKLHRQVERHTAGRRDIGKEEDAGGKIGSMEAVSPEPTPDEAAVMAEELERVMQRTSPTARRVLELRLQGHTIEEIADAIGRSQRTARRLLDGVRQDMEQQLRAFPE
ncbi:MAG: helix-turn-helix domain-containing protein [Planctomycetes bacterium]|nr:helix-turn-helix domain-containing protein [Planctomycetota bacterium]